MTEEVYGKVTVWENVGENVEYENSTITDALKEYLSDCNYDPDDKTFWVTLYYFTDDNEDDPNQRKMEVPPYVPPCEDGHKHEWHSPIDIVGGIKENPGVFGNGGGVIIKQVCKHCGLLKITDTWAQDMTDGEQGLTSVTYEREDNE